MPSPDENWRILKQAEKLREQAKTAETQTERDRLLREYKQVIMKLVEQD